MLLNYLSFLSILWHDKEGSPLDYLHQELNTIVLELNAI